MQEKSLPSQNSSLLELAAFKVVLIIVIFHLVCSEDLTFITCSDKCHPIIDENRFDFLALS